MGWCEYGDADLDPWEMAFFEWFRNSDVYHINARQNCNFHQSSLNLSLCQIGVYSVGIKIFNSLPQRIKNLSDKHKQFQSALQNYFHAGSAVM